jgi:hypothetical protein
MFFKKEKTLKRNCEMPIEECSKCFYLLYQSSKSKFLCGYDLTNVRELENSIGFPEWCPLPITKEN